MRKKKREWQVISIPSGAIKRTFRLQPSCSDTSFQFLLVRLRGSTHTFIFAYIKISIPSGAIKSRICKIQVCSFSEFQFLLVRLRAGRSEGIGDWKDEFQFLLVRLRVPVVSSIVLLISLFQFLLVRLRERRGWCTDDAPSVISIPSGAIKRVTRWMECWSWCVISIPSGAIKSKHLPPLPINNRSFQFLLVRLRGDNRQNPTWRCAFISIPSGAIKS